MNVPEVCDVVLSQRPVLLAVVDGMGGYEGGALAAKIVCEKLSENVDKGDLFSTHLDVNEDERTLRLLLVNAALRMKAEALNNPRLSEMGAVVSGILLREKSILAFNCGDCRAYRFSAGCLERVTRDHSRVQELFEQEEISEEEMRRHPRKNIVTSSVSVEFGDNFEFFVRELPICEGDTLFICSDGVWETLSSKKLTAIFTQDIPLSDMARELFDTLLSANCRDNVSFIMFRWE
jgi:protein phosphatase